MATFHATHSIQLSGWSLAGHRDNPLTSGTFSWTGWSPSHFNGNISDIGTAGALDRGSDFFASSGNTFTGYFVTIGGQNFGIFSVGSLRVIPYNAAQFDITTAFPNTASSTTSFSASLTTAANCFLGGTRIVTPMGAQPVETLRPGDLIVTSEGAAIPALWIWQQPITNIFGLGTDRAPIRIAAHALGPNCPERDLMVTADHALWIDGFLIHAGALVNGTTIWPVPMADMPASFSYWHIETEAHSLIMAESCPVESFVPYTARSAYEDHAAYLAQYGHDRIIAELPLPRIGAARLVPAAIRARLDIARAA